MNKIPGKTATAGPFNHDGALKKKKGPATATTTMNKTSLAQPVGVGRPQSPRKKAASPSPATRSGVHNATGRKGDSDGKVRPFTMDNRKNSLSSPKPDNRKFSISSPKPTNTDFGNNNRKLSMPPPSGTSQHQPRMGRRMSMPPSQVPTNTDFSNHNRRALQAPSRPASLVYEDMEARGRGPDPKGAKGGRHAGLRRSQSSSPAITRKKSIQRNTTVNDGIMNLRLTSLHSHNYTPRTNGGQQSPQRQQYQQQHGAGAKTRSLHEGDDAPPSTPPNQIQDLVQRTFSQGTGRFFGRNNSIHSNRPTPHRTASFVPGTAYFGTRSDHTQSNDRKGFGGVDDVNSATGRSEETAAFPDDAKWQRALRYVRILPPTPNETPVKLLTRIFLWCSLSLDIGICVVAITTFTTINTCCGQSIWNVGGTIDWNKTMKIVCIIYAVAIFLEVIPVVREGIPLNMINPIFGFMISFAVFFDNSRNEAITMWALEVCAVIFEFLVYRCRCIVYNANKSRIDEIEGKLDTTRKAKKSSNATIAMGGAPPKDSYDGFGDIDDDVTTTNYYEMKLLRERRSLRTEVASERVNLRYHLVGVIFNAILIFVTLMVVIFIAKSGGLCISDYQTPNPFAQDQHALCPACRSVSGVCEICAETTAQCYYPYY